MHARTFKLVLEYDGSDFAGWQVQPDQRTVQGVLERAFSDLAGAKVGVTGAGRTDAGVHALGQVAHATADLALSTRAVASALNARLPEDLLVKRVDEVAGSFHARFDAVSRSYLYLIGRSKSPIWRRHRWLVRSELDMGEMHRSSQILLGEHDFSSFCLAGSAPDHHRCRVEAISIEWQPGQGGMFVFRIEANRFLRGMVRSIVGTLVEVGRRKITPDEFAVILGAMDRGRAGRTAPALGLYLMEVKYR
jgi:tRNA pseudouridine38-40 synthase